MSSALVTGGLPLLVLCVALAFGPLPFVVRGYLRVVFDRAKARRWTGPATLGFGVGLAASVAVIAVIDVDFALGAALLCLLVLLASIDWQWRWLPIEWTLGVIALAFIFAFQSGDPLQVVLQMAVPALALLITRQILLWALKKEAMGLGDIWLVLGLGGFLLPFQSFLLIGFASLSGLSEVGARRLWKGASARNTAVSYGTHLCLIFVMIRNFPSIW
ncbi:prepilin peptidase [Loktanella sp. Alg231-35]|uniref:prepilin peptidase n=1 Tax=Loktanella sp. Alg231-35 TaxID=1922220 RepID=UPI000D55D126|nr:prepilin peptidase [Loktanella sp. Alg231-35]